ncbi:Response regulator protein VraR [bioreactor metagenome]|uniref:Response regulator protein VraR n=1 Tax=bioreactor metagenome TaxID=1076179 RepID=A0A644YM85_9ZZZZ
MTPSPIHILIADDHLIVREGLRLILETDANMEVLGEAVNGKEAVDLANQLQPDVILMDLRMPVMDGLSAIELIRQQQPQIAIVILTNFNEDEMMVKGLSVGARGFLLKDTDRETLLNTIHAAARGETLLRPEILARLMSHTQAVSVRPAETASGTALTERELEVLRAVARGERSKEIAYNLGITERTVKAHLASIFTRLGVDSRASAIATAARLGLLKDEE